MPKRPDPKRKQAQEIWKNSGGRLKLIDIAKKLGVPEATIRAWKSKDRWKGKERFAGNNTERSEKKRSAPKEEIKRGRGREPSGKYVIDEMVAAIREYTDTASYPILKEICLKKDWSYDSVMRLKRENEDLQQSIKRLHDKREVILEQGGVSGKLNTSFTIFALKQPVHGWTDKPVLEQDIQEINNNLIALSDILKNPLPPHEIRLNKGDDGN